MNSADEWIISDVIQEIQRIAGVDEEMAKEYIEGYEFEGYLMEEPLDVRHKSPLEWAKWMIERRGEGEKGNKEVTSDTAPYKNFCTGWG